MKRILAALILAGPLLGLGAEPAAVPLFQGRTSANLPLTFPEGPKAPAETRLEALVGGDLTADPWHFRLLGGLRTAPGTQAWALSEAWIAVGEGAPLQVQAGWWPDRTGPALFRSVVPAFTSAAGTDFLASAGGSRAPVPLKAAVRATWEEWSLEAEVNPWVEPPALPDVNSVWFPRKDIPSRFYLNPTYHYDRESVSTTQDGAFASGWTWDYPFRARVLWSSLWGDTQLGVFHGPDDLPSYLSGAEPDLLTSTMFHLVIVPKRNIVMAPWATIEVPWEGGKLWLEQRVTMGRLASDLGGKPTTGVGVIDTTSIVVWQATRTTDTSETVAGASYSFSFGAWGTVRVWTEGLWYRDLRDPARPAPDFSQGAEAGFHWDQSQGLGSLDVMAGTPWDPAQGWVLARATWNWMEGRSLWAAVPGFWGPKTSLWGQFTDRRYLAVGASWDQ